MSELIGDAFYLVVLLFEKCSWKDYLGGQKMIISDTIRIIQLEEALVVEFKDVITLRKTTRKYLPEQISENQLQAILLAAQTAPLATGDDKILVYYGAADTYMCLATGLVGDLIPKEIR
jgi:hypothetical protein